MAFTHLLASTRKYSGEFAAESPQLCLSILVKQLHLHGMFVIPSGKRGVPYIILQCYVATSQTMSDSASDMGNAVWNAQLCMLQTVPQSPSDIDSAPVASVRQKSPPGYKVFASPATKHLAKENNINLAEVTGTGPEGRITRGKGCQVVAQAMTIVPKPFGAHTQVVIGLLIQFGA